jgi:hypothetical protein
MRHGVLRVLGIGCLDAALESCGFRAHRSARDLPAARASSFRDLLLGFTPNSVVWFRGDGLDGAAGQRQRKIRQVP